MEPWQIPQTNLTDIPIGAEELLRRIPRSPDLQAENQALQTLARQLATSPRTLLKTLVAIAQELCSAGSVGVCLLEENTTSEQIFRWEALAGAWEAAEQTNTLRRLQLSGADRDLPTPQLYFHPEQSFTGLPKPELPIAEALVVPLQSENRLLGAIWIVSHDRDRQFDSEDLRIAIALADFAVVALQLDRADRADRTKEALRESEERWQLACAGNNDGIWDRNLHTNCFVVSDRCLEILERDREECQHFSQYLSWIHPDDLEIVQSNWQQHLHRETSHYCCEYRIRCRDGRYKWVWARGQAIWDESGNPVRAVGSLTDISENRYRTLADALPQLMWIKGADGRLEFCNQHWQNYTGIRPEFPAVASMLEIFHPLDLPKIVAIWNQAIQAAESYEFECRLLRFDSIYRWHLARVVPVKDRAGQVLQWVGIGIDIDDRKRVEESLAESDRRFRFLAESLPHLIWNVDSAGETRFANQKWSEYLGMSYQEAAQNNWESLVPPSDLAEGLARWQESLITGEVYQAEFRLRRASDGMDRWHLSRAVPIRDARGQIVEWIGTNTDIHDRKQAQLNEQFLSQLEVRLRQRSKPAEMLWEAQHSLGEYLQVDRCVWHEIDLEADLIIVQQDWHQSDLASVAGTYQISDFKTAQLKALSMASQTLVISDVANDPQTAPFVDNYGAVGIRALVDVPCLQEGRWVALLIVTSQAVRHWRPDEVSLIQEMVARLWTVILHARALQDLHESEDRFRALADNIAQLAWMTDASGWIFWYNQRWFDYTGTTLEAMQGWGWQQVHHPEHVDRVVAKFRHCIETGEAWEDTFPLRGTDGSYRWFLSRAVPIRDAQDKVLRWCGTNTDITDRLNAEAERERLLALEKAARAEAERANRVKDEFLAVLSHELRTPLNPIMGWAKLLRSNCLTPEKQLYALETIERNAKLQTQLIEDLLDVSGILQGKVSLNIVPVDLAEAIGFAIETVCLSAKVKSIQISTQFTPDLGRVLGDARRLQQVVWNLLSNAVKFTSPGGKIAVKLDRTRTDAQITVTDTGQGISPDFLPYVFDYFRQADSTFTRKFGGLGLGLAIVRHLVELHGGTVKSHSPGEGQGATFTIRIPLMPVQPPTTPVAPSPEEFLNLSGIRVLAVDDDADARDLVVFLLEDCGASVTAVSNADDALAVLTQSVPDVLLSDIGMPDTDGYMLLRQVRALPPEQGGLVPAIALTAYAGEIDYQEALAAGFQRHLSKPLDPDKLVQAMLDLLVDRSDDKNIV